MLLPFEVCEVCGVCHSHANPEDNPSHLFPETSVHGAEALLGLRSAASLDSDPQGLWHGREAIFRGLLDVGFQSRPYAL